MPDVLFLIVLAPVVGSFISVVSGRYPHWQEIAMGRSRCPSCGQVLTASELVPIVSWLVQRGRCRSCAGWISARYLWIELAATTVAVWGAIMVSGPLLFVTCGLGWTLVALAAIDARHFVLPDLLTLPLGLAGLAVAWTLHPEHLVGNVVGAVVGYVSFLVLAVAYERLRGRPGLGLGDAKLFAAAGAWVSWSGLPSIAIIAGLSGLGAALLHAALTRRPLDLKTRLPFGPFLAFGFWLVWLHGPLVLNF
jgi:leader peptidase (prepilin peptidase)/N-methyltransferase